MFNDTEQVLNQFCEMVDEASKNFADLPGLKFLDQLNRKLQEREISEELAHSIVANVDVDITQGVLSDDQLERLSTCYADFIKVAVVESQKMNLPVKTFTNGLSVTFTG